MRRPLEESSLRIAIVIERFVPGAGGVENVAWQVAHELAQQGEDVTIVAREAAGETPLPVRLIFAPATWQPTRLALFSWGAARATRGDAFDVVHSFSHTRHQDLFRAGGGSQMEHLRRNHRGAGRALRRLSPRYRIRLDVERFVFRKSHQRIQCASSLVADALTRDYGLAHDRIFMLPNAVDRAFFGDAALHAEAQAFRTQLSGDDARVWLFPGSGWHRKGLATALAAVAAAGDSNLELWIAGRDAAAPWKRRAQSLGLADRVHFLGERSDMPLLYHAVDGVLLPTRYDAFANVTLEAAAAGCPILTTAANGATEWLGGEAHVIDDPEDAPTFAAAIDRYRDEALRKETGDRLRACARQFGWEAHVKALRLEYRNIAARRKSN